MLCRSCGSPLKEPRKLKDFCSYSCRGQHSVKALDGPKYGGAYSLSVSPASSHMTLALASLTSPASTRALGFQACDLAADGARRLRSQTTS
jgi:hypothetical protein